MENWNIQGRLYECISSDFSACAHAVALINLIDNASSVRRARVTVASPGYIGHGHNDGGALNNSSDDTHTRARTHTKEPARRERRGVPGPPCRRVPGRSASAIDMRRALHALARKETPLLLQRRARTLVHIYLRKNTGRCPDISLRNVISCFIALQRN